MSLFKRACIQVLSLIWLTFVSLVALVPALMLYFSIVIALLYFSVIQISNTDKGLGTTSELQIPDVSTLDPNRYEILRDEHGKPAIGRDGGFLVVNRELQSQLIAEMKRKQLRRDFVFWSLLATAVLATFIAARRRAFQLHRTARIRLSTIGGLSAGLLASLIAPRHGSLSLAIALGAACVAVAVHQCLEALAGNACFPNSENLPVTRSPSETPNRDLVSRVM